MGLLRFLLALSVVGSHAGYPLWMDGRSAVLLFYVVSGYLITMVLNGSYKDGTAAFYLNRALRIFAPALVVTLLFWALIAAMGMEQPALRGPTLAIKTYSVLTNFLLVGQDLAWLFVHNPAGHVFWQPIGDPGGGVIGLYGYQANGPMFTIAIELYFYLLAPFVVRSVPRTIAFALAGAAYHVVLYATGLSSLGLSYHLFVSAFFYFGSGALVYHLTTTQSPRARNAIYATLVAMVTANVVCMKVVGIPAAYLCLLFGLPALIGLSSKVAADKFVGNLSYLIYLIHWPVLFFVPDAPSGLSKFAAVTTISVVLSLGLHYVVEKPLDRVRDVVRARGGFRSIAGAILTRGVARPAT